MAVQQAAAIQKVALNQAAVQAANIMQHFMTASSKDTGGQMRQLNFDHMMDTDENREFN